MAEQLQFDPDAWTLGDMETFEELTGLTIGEAFTEAAVKDSAGQVEVDNRGRPVKRVRMSAKVMVAVVFIEKRRGDNTFTLDEARAVKISEFVLTGGSPDPKGKRPAKKASASSRRSAGSTG